MNTTNLGLGELFDSALGDEIELVGALVVAAASCHGRMCASELDAALGVEPCAA
jgi:hypothetical protein